VPLAEPHEAFERVGPPAGIVDVAIVGGGAAGLAAAIMAARRLPGARVAVFDGARRIGAKILVSGGGRCNVTNRVVRASDFAGGDRRVVESALRSFGSADAVEFFEGLGVRLHEEEDGKLFPDSGRSSTVLEAMVDGARRSGVEIHTGQRVETVWPDARGGFAVGRHGASDAARRVLLATGGLSLPKSGSDGRGLAVAASLGHRVVPTTPALAPLVLAGAFHRPLAGVSHDAEISIGIEGRRAVRLRGALLWTHFGVSGPIALDASRHWHRGALEGRAVAARLSFVPGLDFGGVERRLLEAAAARPSATLKGALAEFLPAAVGSALLQSLGIDPVVRLAHLTRDPRRRLAGSLASWDLPVTGSRGYNFAEATAGGVALDEIDRTTMESRKCPGLFLAGEMLDVDGRLGGFNFQWAWSSAFVAARGLARSLQGEQRDV
jgi:predicted Rossmann fold flavoprotein